MQMGGMHQRPARIHRGVIQQPLHRTRTANGFAFAYFRHLFGDVDVDRQVTPLHKRHQRIQGVGRHRAQTVQGHADFEQMAFLCPQRFKQFQVVVKRMTETALPGMQRPAVESAGLVKHGQQGQPDAGIFGGADDGLRHFRRVGIGAAIRLMMQIMEFADLAVTGFQHFAIELGGNRIQLFGIDFSGETVHLFAPGPEAVGRIPAAFGQPGHGTLKGMAVTVGDCG